MKGFDKIRKILKFFGRASRFNKGVKKGMEAFHKAIEEGKSIEEAQEIAKRVTRAVIQGKKLKRMRKVSSRLAKWQAQIREGQEEAKRLKRRGR